jgi:hypothetical protein
LQKKVSEHTWLQRIGYIIDNIDPIDTSKQIKIVKAIADGSDIISNQNSLMYLYILACQEKGHVTRSGESVENTTIESDI